ncbi:MAG TPA: TIGR03089 family protein [Aeromicrobium sp.]|nr:TIGR03089 family protein [Aeromicrobium sp.]
MEFLTHWSGVRPGGPGRPFVTYYDIATGERTELSGSTTANWVAKTANLLVDELDAEPGTRIEVALPTHWLRTVWILATWAAGGTIVDAGGDVFVAGPDSVEHHSPARHRLASALLPFATPFPTPPPGVIDLGAVLPGQPDAFFLFDEPTDDVQAVDVVDFALTYGQLMAGAPPSSGRSLLTPGTLARDVTATLAAALGGGSIVLVRGASAADVDRLAGQEQALLA